MSGETCNHCDGDIECDENVVAMVCPSCGNITGVCANCQWHYPDLCGIDCPFNIVINQEEKQK